MVCSTPLKGESFPKLGCNVSPINSSVVVLTSSKSEGMSDSPINSSIVVLTSLKSEDMSDSPIHSSIVVLTSSKSEDMSEAYWKKRLGLFEGDRTTVYAASILMKEQFPHQQGLRDTLLLQHLGKYDSGVNQFIQILHINGNHWLCISNKFSPIGTVDVLDCSAGNGNSLSLKKQIAVLLKCVSSFFSMRHKKSKDKLVMQTVVSLPLHLPTHFAVVWTHTPFTLIKVQCDHTMNCVWIKKNWICFLHHLVIGDKLPGKDSNLKKG